MPAQLRYSCILYLKLSYDKFCEEVVNLKNNN